jgi:hypothetical protein
MDKWLRSEILRLRWERLSSEKRKEMANFRNELKEKAEKRSSQQQEEKQ